MAIVTKYYLIEQIRLLLGEANAGAKFEPRVIQTYLQQIINKKLKAEYFDVTLPNDETIPQGLVLASYDAIKVEKYKGLSRAKLPAMPINLRRGMGVYFVGPAVSNNNLYTPAMTTIANKNSGIDLAWSLVPNATTYYVERALDAGFTVGLSDVYLGSGLSFSDIGLTAIMPYFYRVTAKANGYASSGYGFSSCSTTTVHVFDSTFDNTFN